VQPDTVLRVLVIDDDVDGADILAELLRELGHDVATAREGLSALEMDATWNPEVAIVDLQLPGMDGHEVARQLRARRPGLRIIALSGLVRQQDRERSRLAGCDLHLTKPANFDEIVRALCRGR
jgi:CheY-like chemotaxis protein